MYIRFATDKDLDQLKALWYECFEEHDGKESIDHYFESRYSHEYSMLLLSDTDEILCSLQINPHELMIENNVLPVRFFVGVSTPLKHRKKGYMRILIDEALRYLKDDLHHELCILQAYNWDVYTNFGFQIHYYKKESEVLGNGLQLPKLATRQDILKLLDLYRSYTKHFSGYALRNYQYYEDQFDNFEIENVKCYLGDDFYYTVVRQGIETIILEFIYLPSFNFEHVEAYFTGDVNLQTDLRTSLPGKEIPFMAIKPLVNDLYIKYPDLKDKEKLFISEQT